jgi:hypothetical protein
MKTSALFLITVFAFSNIAYSQNDSSGKDIGLSSGDIFIKAGIDLHTFSAVSLNLFPPNFYNFWGSIAYEFDKKYQLELLYKYIGGLKEDYKYINYQGENPRYYHFENFDDYHSNDFYLKANIFIGKDKKVNLYYLTGSFIYSLQGIVNKDSLWKSYDDTAVHYTKYNYSYSRILFGFNFGAGFYFNMGHFGFQNELSFSAKFAPFTDKGYREFILGLSIAPVYKF